MSEKTPNFEATMTELQATVEALEKGNLPLEDALAQFEKAVKLSKSCQQVLQEAELKISQIAQDGTEVSPPEVTLAAQSKEND